MKKQSKKLISLLAVSCLATAAVAGLAACGEEENPSANAGMTARDVYELYAKAESNPLTYEEWLESIRGPQGVQGPQGEQGPQGVQGPSGETHVHNFGTTVIEIIPATGVKDGVGVKICPDDNEMQFVLLPKIAGIVAANPIEVAVGATETVTLNTYDSDRYGVSVDSGEKNVMYFSTYVENSGLLALSANVPGVTYEYYTSETLEYKTVRYIEAQEYSYITWGWVDSPKTIYVKMTFPANSPATAEVTAKLTALPENKKLVNTVQLPEGVTAESLNVYAWGIASWDEDMNPVYDWKLQEYLGDDLVPFNGTNAATIALSPLDYSKYKLEVTGVDEGHAILEDIILEFPDDGSSDAGITVKPSAVNQHKFTFTVQDANGAMAGANVELQDYWYNPLSSATTDEDGKVEFLIPEDEYGDFAYCVAVTDLPFGYNKFESLDLSLDQKDVTLTVTGATVATWTADGTKASVLNGAASYATVEIAEGQEGEYVFELSDSDSANEGMFSIGNYIFQVNGESIGSAAGKKDPTIVLNNFNSATEDASGNAVMQARVTLKAGVNTIKLDVYNSGYAYTTLQASLKKYTPPETNDIVLGVAKTVSEGKTYIFTAEKAGTYSFTTSVADGQKNEYAEYYESQAAYDAGDWSFWAAQDSFPVYATVYTKELAAGESFSFYVYNCGDGDFTITVTKNSIELALDTAVEVVAGEICEFTATEAGVYVIAPNGANAANVSSYLAVNYAAEGNAFAVGGAAGMIYIGAGETVEFVFTNGDAGNFNVTVSQLNPPVVEA